MTREARRDDAGGAVVEFALVVPVLVLLLVGVLSLGLALSTSLSLSNAVREGSRFAATLADAATASATWSQAVRQRTSELALVPGMDADDFCVQLVKGASVLHDDCSAAFTPPAPPTGVGASDCLVLVWTERVVDVPVLPSDPTLTEHSVARYERSC